MDYNYNLALLFQNQVNVHFNKTALAFSQDEKYTYRQLNTRANQIARFLSVESNIQSKDVVALINEKSFNSFAAMIACLKIGAIYTNIDKDNATQRIHRNFETCRPKIVLSDVDDDKIKTLCKNDGVVFYPFNEIEEKLVSYDVGNLEKTKSVTGDNPAYIMFTSGSTGVPKGVLISHQNVIHFIDWAVKRFEVTYADRLTNVNPIYFDNSVFDFYTALFSGASLAPIRKELLKKPGELVNKIDALECTIWFSVPSFLIYLNTMKVLSADVFKSIRIISFGGEGYHKKSLKELYDTYGDRIKFINVYGPTEATCICSTYDISDNDFAHLDSYPPLGIMNQNFGCLIIDDGKISDTGELYLSGPNVGMGYYNDKKRTKESFVNNQFNRMYDETLYRTGDLVKEESGLLYFVGRADNQIKHMGYRIELEEIEHALNSLSGVNQAAVIYKRVNSNFGKIIAYISSDDSLDTKGIKESLRIELPDYMLPNKISLLDALPKNPNGKIDRQYLSNL